MFCVAAPAKDIEAAFQRDGEKVHTSCSCAEASGDVDLPSLLSPCLCSSTCPPGGPAALKVGPGSSSGAWKHSDMWDVLPSGDPTGQSCGVLSQQADSEGDLCPTSSPTLTGSSSTLASSFIEVELEGPDPEVAPPNQEVVLEVKQLLARWPVS